MFKIWRVIYVVCNCYAADDSKPNWTRVGTAADSFIWITTIHSGGWGSTVTRSWCSKPIFIERDCFWFSHFFSKHGQLHGTDGFGHGKARHSWRFCETGTYITLFLFKTTLHQLCTYISVSNVNIHIRLHICVYHLQWYWQGKVSKHSSFQY